MSIVDTAQHLQQAATDLFKKRQFVSAALQHQDPITHRDTIKSLYHIGYSFGDLSTDFEEVAGTPGVYSQQMQYDEALSRVDDYDWRNNINELLSAGLELYHATTKLCDQLKSMGMEASTRHLRRSKLRLKVDLDFLTADLKDANLLR